MKLRVSGGSRRPVSVRTMLARAGRVVLWLGVLLLVARGVASVAAREKEPTSARVRAVAEWPDEAVRAWAVEFATAYLTLDPRDPVGRRAALEALATPEVAGTSAAIDAEGGRQTVVSATVERATRVDDSHALVTVAARMGGAPVRTVRLTVPMARDMLGGLVVDDLPALGGQPGRAEVSSASGEPMLGAERAAIGDVVTRFLRAFVAGDRAGLVYLAPPGVAVQASAGGFELLEVGSVASIGPEAGRVRVVLVSVRVRDRVSRTVLALRYRVGLVQRDRWYVAAVNDPAGERRMR